MNNKNGEITFEVDNKVVGTLAPLSNVVVEPLTNPKKIEVEMSNCENGCCAMTAILRGSESAEVLLSRLLLALEHNVATGEPTMAKVTEYVPDPDSICSSSPHAYYISVAKFKAGPVTQQ